MSIYDKRAHSCLIGKSLLVLLLCAGGLWVAFKLADVEAQELLQNQEASAVEEALEYAGTLPIVEDNSVLSSSQNNVQTPAPPPAEDKPVKKIDVILTAYSSTTWQTDDTPYTTAAGTQVRDGIVANNLLPFGTKIKIPNLFGDKIFTVEDRMHWGKSNYQIDIWFSDTVQALNFGVRNAAIEIMD